MNFKTSVAGRVAARVLARVRGLTVVLVGGLAAFVIFASFELPTWEKIVGYSVIGLLIVLASLKLFISGEEGPTDFHAPEFAMSNLPPWIALILIMNGSLRAYLNRPRPREAGIIEGSAYDPASVKPLAASPPVPDLPVTEGAASLGAAEPP